MRGMKVKDADILIVPGYTNSGPDHWQTPLAGEAVDRAPRRAGRMVEAGARGLDGQRRQGRQRGREAGGDRRPFAGRPDGDPGHSRSSGKPVAGAFLVAPPDVANPAIRPKHLMTFGPYPRDPLPFPSIMVGSRNDPFCAFEVAEDIAAAWGSLFIDAGEAGHINADSGYGPWPEGSMAFAQFLSRL